MGPVFFTTDQGRIVQPLFVAPWLDEKGTESLPGLLRGMKGEWPCVPFGVERNESIEGWEARADAIGDGNAHGYSSNHAWDLLERGDGWITIGIEYPDQHPIRRLRRKISGRTGEAAIDIELDIEVAKDIALGLAVHPTFRLPTNVGMAKLDVLGLEKGLTFPASLDSSGRAKPAQWFSSLNKVPGTDADFVNFSRLPFERPNEDLLQVRATDGRVRLSNLEEKWTAQVSYDPILFSSVVIWVTNGGWTNAPWSGRTRGLGIEPARAAFDLGQSVSADENNPLVRAGIPTSISLLAGQSLSTRYSISVEDLSE